MSETAAPEQTTDPQESTSKLRDILVRAQRLESISVLIAHNGGDALLSLPRLQRADVLDEISEQATDIRCRIQSALL